MTFKFNLGTTVTIEIIGKQGKVIGRAEYVNAENTYLLRYTNTEGKAMEDWWGESALT